MKKINRHITLIYSLLILGLVSCRSTVPLNSTFQESINTYRTEGMTFEKEAVNEMIADLQFTTTKLHSDLKNEQKDQRENILGKIDKILKKLEMNTEGEAKENPQESYIDQQKKQDHSKLIGQLYLALDSTRQAGIITDGKFKTIEKIISDSTKESYTPPTDTLSWPNKVRKELGLLSEKKPPKTAYRNYSEIHNARRIASSIDQIAQSLYSSPDMRMGLLEMEKQIDQLSLQYN